MTYIPQEAPLGLAPAVKISEEHLGTEPFVMFRRGRDVVVEKYDWSAIAQKLEGVYKKIMNRGT